VDSPPHVAQSGLPLYFFLFPCCFLWFSFARRIKMPINPNQIGKTKAVMTIVGGKAVYQDPAWKDEQPTGL
jgi:hypothetical protein